MRSNERCLCGWACLAFGTAGGRNGLEAFKGRRDPGMLVACPDCRFVVKGQE